MVDFGSQVNENYPQQIHVDSRLGQVLQRLEWNTGISQPPFIELGNAIWPRWKKQDERSEISNWMTSQKYNSTVGSGMVLRRGKIETFVLFMNERAEPKCQEEPIQARPNKKHFRCP